MSLIYGKICTEHIMPMKEIQDFFEKQPQPISPRQTIRIVHELEDDGLIRKRKIKGKRKQKGYTINEKNIETISDIWFHFPKSKYIKKAFNDFYDQFMLSSFLDLWDERYRDSLIIKKGDSKKLKKMKEEWKENFVWIQYRDMYHTLQVLTNLEWALRTGMLGTGKGKIRLAETNIGKLERLLERMSDDLKEHDQKIWKQVIISVYNALEDNRRSIITSEFSPNERLTKTKS